MLTQLPGAVLIQSMSLGLYCFEKDEESGFELRGAFTVLGIGVLVQSIGTLGTAALQYLNDPQATVMSPYVRP